MKLVWFDSIDSTQDYIKSHIQELDNDTCVIADLQVKGRGRYGHVWYSSQKDGLYFSIFKKNINTNLLPIITGVSLYNTIKRIYNITSFIKWPNDIYIMFDKPRKIAGILVERIKDSTIIGIGVNLNQEEFPQDILNAVSLRTVSCKYISKQEFLLNFFDAFYKDLDFYFKHGFDAFYRIVNENLLYKDKLITANNGKVQGILKGVDMNGSIVVEKGDELLILNAGEIEALRAQELW